MYSPESNWPGAGRTSGIRCCAGHPSCVTTRTDAVTRRGQFDLRLRRAPGIRLCICASAARTRSKSARSRRSRRMARSRPTFRAAFRAARTLVTPRPSVQQSGTDWYPSFRRYYRRPNLAHRLRVVHQFERPAGRPILSAVVRIPAALISAVAVTIAGVIIYAVTGGRGGAVVVALGVVGIMRAVRSQG